MFGRNGTVAVASATACVITGFSSSRYGLLTPAWTKKVWIPVSWHKGIESVRAILMFFRIMASCVLASFVSSFRVASSRAATTSSGRIVAAFLMADNNALLSLTLSVCLNMGFQSSAFQGLIATWVCEK